MVGLREPEAYITSKVQKCAIVPVRRSGIAEGPCGQRQFFSSSVDLFFFDLLLGLICVSPLLSSLNPITRTLRRALKGMGDKP